MKLFRRKFYDRLTFDEFRQWEQSLFDIGFYVSAWPGNYGKATCLNCRAIVDIGVPEMSRRYAKQHRETCGDQHLADVYRSHMTERLAAIER